MISGKFSWVFVIIFAFFGTTFWFFYFETSWILRILVILLGLIGMLALRRRNEFFVLLIFYLGLYDLYNIRYGLAVPLSTILIAVFAVTTFVFYLWIRSLEILKDLNKNILWLYLVATALVVMETFLAMSFWPVDPKIKSLVISGIFFVILKVFYLHINNVLNLKKVIVFILVSILILGSVVAYNIYFGF